MSKSLKLPKNLAQAADALYKVRQERLAIQKQASELEVHEKALKEHLIQNLPKSKAGGITGKVCRVEIVKKQIPQVADWKKLDKWVEKNKAQDIIKRSLDAAAVRERWEDEVVIPGVEAFTVVSLSVNKV